MSLNRILAVGVMACTSVACEPAHSVNPTEAQGNQPTATGGQSPAAAAAVTQLGPTTATPAIAQALANGLPIDVAHQDPNGNWRYAVSSKGQGDMQVSFQLGGGGQGATTANASNIHQRVADRLTASRAQQAQRRQALQQRLAAMKSRVGQATASAGALPIEASFNIHIDGHFDADAMKAQMAKLQQAARAQQGAGGKGLTWTFGAPKAAAPAPAQPMNTPIATAVGAQRPGTLPASPQVVYIPVPGAPQAPPRAAAGHHAAPGVVQGEPALDEETRDAIEETAELYLWLGAKGELDDARDLVVERCRDEAVGHVQAVTFLEQPLELTESQVTARRVRSGAATVAYDLTGTLTQELEGGEPIASAVNLTGELMLEDTEHGWLVSCPE